jgi:hypothetical protein
MTNRLSYRHLKVSDLIFKPPELAGPYAFLFGRFREEERTLEGIGHAKAYGSAAGWFANQPLDGFEDIKRFTEKYGLLRMNWTAAGWSDGAAKATELWTAKEGRSLSRWRPANEFAFYIDDFRQLHQQFRARWASAARGTGTELATISEWLCKNLDSIAGGARAKHWSKTWELSPSRISLNVQRRGQNALSGMEINLVLGDLWQALCCELLDTINERQGLLRVCRENSANHEKYFVTRDSRKVFCSHECAKRSSDRAYMKRKRAAITQQREH